MSRDGSGASGACPSRFTRLLLLRWRPSLSIVFCGLLGTMLPAAYGLAIGIREPGVHDEFSYLLGADTFAHGRLTNPSPSLPEFFEAPHILVSPTYASKYPPGQALILALGQRLFGRPIWGVWLSCGLFAASLCWMLLSWTSKPWALAITIAAIATTGVSTYWAQSYWGGMLAACGSALLFGGTRRTIRSPRTIHTLVTAVGVLVLANTRMYEGLLVCVAAAVPLGWWLVRGGRTPLRLKLTRMVLPFAIALLAGGSLMAVFNHAVTGHFSNAPYEVHNAQYMGQGAFLFSELRAPERTPTAHVARFYSDSTHAPERGWRLVEHVVRNIYDRLPATVESALGAVDYPDGGRQPYRALSLWAFAFLIPSLRSRWAWFCIGTFLAVVAGQSLVWWWFPHYSAPLVPLVLAVVAIALRRTVWSRDRRDRLRLCSPPVVVVFSGLYVMVSPVLRVVAPDRTGEARTSGVGTVSASTPESPRLSASMVRRQLESQGASHLVFVDYDDNLTSQDGEWVYNPADLNGARVIFAHDLGAAKNPLLMRVYPERRVWRVHVSRGTTQLSPYPAQ